jgi:hypothetical protein
MRTRGGEVGVLVYVKNPYPYPVRFNISGKPQRAQPGFSRHFSQTKDSNLRADFETGEHFEFKLGSPPQRTHRIHLAPTVHTDWGYTDLQERTEAIHAENMEKMSAIASAGGKFVVEVLEQSGGEGMKGMLRHNTEGRVGVQAFPLNVLTGLCDHEELVRMFYPVRELRKRGFKIGVAALNDIPTAVWSLPMVLKGAGIAAYIQASNADRGPLHYLNQEIESPFCWVGPDGSGIVSWFSGGYRGLLSGFSGYNQGASAGLLGDLGEAEAGIAEFLHNFVSRGYPHEDMLMYGLFSDNVPVSDKFVKVVEEFREKWENPSLVLSTTDDFFRKFEGAELKSVKGDFGDYWADGAASSAKELAVNRRAKKLLYFLEALFAFEYLRGAPYPRSELETIRRNVLFFDEHTWGDHASISDPLNPRVLEEWRVKSRFALDALSGAEQMSSGEYVSNPFPFSAEGVVGNSHVALPPMGSAPLLAKSVDEIPVLGNDGEFATPFYSLRVEGGKIVSLSDSELGELLGKGFGFDEYVYLAGGKSTGMERTYYPGPRSPGGITPPAYVTYREYSSKLVSAFENDDILGLEVEATGYLARIRKRVILPKKRREVIVENTVRKTPTFEKEGIYFAFPFNLKSPSFQVEEPGVVTDVEREYVRGGCVEWFSMNEFVLLKGDFDIAFHSQDAPLVTLGEPFTGKWRPKVEGDVSTLFSYVMNNYWHTNYKASQGGELAFRYRLTSSSQLRPSKVQRFFAGPVIGRRLDADLRLEPPDVAVTTIKKWDLGEGMVIRLLEMDGEEKVLRLASKALVGFKAYRANLLEEIIEQVGVVEGDGIEVRVPPRSYETFVFARS